MNVFGGRTLRQKLALVLWGTALCAFAASGIALAAFQGLTLERRARAIMEPYADLVSAGTDAAVAFGDPVRAQEILDALRANPEILSAEIVLQDGRSWRTSGRGSMRAGASRGLECISAPNGWISCASCSEARCCTSP